VIFGASHQPACMKLTETVPVDDPLTTFNLRAEAGKPNEASALEVAAERPELNDVAALETNELEPL
jgi:hypothetical protein